jgi:hypothetical protein
MKRRTASTFKLLLPVRRSPFFRVTKDSIFNMPQNIVLTATAENVLGNAITAETALDFKETKGVNEVND